MINYLRRFFPSAQTPFERKLFMPLKFLKLLIWQIFNIAIVEGGKNYQLFDSDAFTFDVVRREVRVELYKDAGR